MKPSISIIIPALNEEGNIKEAVKGALDALDQKFSKYELLIFDDGSTDATGNVAENLARENSHIKVIHNKRSMGLGYNYKRGVEIAQYDYVVMLPGDNEICTHSIKDLFDKVGRDDIVIPYTINFNLRPFLRRIISRTFTWTMNFLFNLNIPYYNGTVVHKTRILTSIPFSTHGFAYQADILTRLIKSGRSYVEVGMYIQKRRYGLPKAFKIKNIISVLDTIIKLFWDIQIIGKRYTG